MTLFRQEANPRAHDRLHGSVHLAVPLSWHIIGGAFGCALLAALVFCWVGTYRRIETVQGVLTTDRGVVAVLPPRTGVLQSILVSEGQHVRAGQVLLQVSTEDATSAGASTQARLISSIEEQQVRIRAQLRQTEIAAAADQSRFAAIAAGLRSDLHGLDDQGAVQSELVATAEDEYRRSQELAANGYVSQVEAQRKRQALLTARNELARLTSSRAAKLSAIEEALQSSRQAEASAKAQLASLDASISELTQHVIGTDAARSYAISASVGGRVTALTAREGQAATPQTTLLQIMPDGARLTAELYAPTDAVGSLAVSDDVRLAVDAFPFHEFGTLDARIERISASTVLANDRQELRVPAYLVSVAINASDLDAFSRDKSLLPGMTLTARIVTRRERIADLMLAPLRSIAKR